MRLERMSYSALSICISLVLSHNILFSSEYAHGSHGLESEKNDLGSAGSFDRTFEDRLNQAKELLSERRYSEAEQIFREIIDDPADFLGNLSRLADVHNYLGVTLHCQQRDAEAIESYKRVLSLHPKVLPSATRAKICSNLALSLSSMGMRAEALKACLQALNHFRHSDVDALTYSVFLNAYGQLLIEDKDWAGAEAIFCRSLVLRARVVGESADLALPLLKLAEIYEAVGKDNLAEILLRRRRRLLEGQSIGGCSGNLAQFEAVEMSGNIRYDYPQVVPRLKQESRPGGRLSKGWN